VGPRASLAVMVRREKETLIDLDIETVLNCSNNQHKLLSH